MEKNQIFIIYGKDYKSMTKNILRESRLADLIGDRKKKIGIKPNLVSPSEPSYGATTHAEILAGLIEYLQERGFLDLQLMEGSWVGARTRDAFDLAGYDRLCSEYGVPFIDMQKEKGSSRICAGMKLNICDRVDEVDFLINVPVLKGHCQTKVTCALKNMKGLIPNAEKRRFHSLGLHKPIAHLNTGIHQDFIVVDNICGDLDFEDGGNPVVMNRILTGRDPVLIDAYVCHLMHYEVDEVPYVRLAEELGVGCADLSRADIRVCGQDTGGEIPLSRKVVELSDAVEEVDSCSACYGCLIPALQRIKEELAAQGKENVSLLELFGSPICIGQGFRGKTGSLGVGHCTSLFDRHVEGCPPTEEEVYRFLKGIISKA